MPGSLHLKPLLGKIPLNKFAPSEPRRYSTSYRRSARAACRRSVVRALVLVNAIAPRYQAMALLATWAGLRYGEAAGLKRADIDLRAGTVRVDRQLQELAGGVLVEGPPKTDGGATPTHRGSAGLAPRHLRARRLDEPRLHVSRGNATSEEQLQPPCVASGVHRSRALRIQISRLCRHSRYADLVE